MTIEVCRVEQIKKPNSFAWSGYTVLSIYLMHHKRDHWFCYVHLMDHIYWEKNFIPQNIICIQIRDISKKTVTRIPM